MKTVDEYILQVADDKKETISKLREIIKENIPIGFEETISYGMIGFVVPHSIYPEGYHCDPKLPLPFINIAAQKNFIALYHMGMYADKGIYEWFVQEYPKHSKYKLDMGKSCIRFKKMEHIPFDLITELIRKISVEQYIETFKNTFKK